MSKFPIEKSLPSFEVKLEGGTVICKLFERFDIENNDVVPITKLSRVLSCFNASGIHGLIVIDDEDLKDKPFIENENKAVIIPLTQIVYVKLATEGW